jgi:aminoglycoside 6'-N-acetyltransferase I
MTVRAVEPGDAAAWQRMREALWPGHADHAAEIAAYFAHPDTGTREAGHAVFLAEVEDQPCGFLELGLRSYAQGCLTTPVPYIEGWWVEPSHRRRGVGRALMAAAAAWAQARGFTELASDCGLANAASTAAHLACGFNEVGRIVCFRKAL